MNRKAEAARHLKNLRRRQKVTIESINTCKNESSLLLKGLALVLTPLVHIVASPDQAISQTPQSASRPENSSVEQVDEALNAFQVLMKEIPPESAEKVGEMGAKTAVPPLPILQEKTTKETPQSESSASAGLQKHDVPSPLPASFEAITGEGKELGARTSNGAGTGAAESVTPQLNNTSEPQEAQPVSADTEQANTSRNINNKESAPSTNRSSEASAQTKSTTKQNSEGLFGNVTENETANFWKSATAVLGLLLVMALFGLQMLRSKKGGQARQKSNAKALELLASLPIGPKRQILLIKVRDAEIAVASTEAGVSLLTESTKHSLGSSGVVSTEFSHLALPQRTPESKTPSDGLKNTAQRILSQVGAARKSEPQAIGGESESKSEILRKAIETIETRRSKPSQAAAPSDSALQTVGTAAPKFKKHASNSYAQIGSQGSQVDSDASEDYNRPKAVGSTLAPRPLAATRNDHQMQKNSIQSSSSRASSSSNQGIQAQTSQAEASQTDNVAQLIREKLKQMKALNS